MPFSRAYRERADLALDAADAETPGNEHTVDVGEQARGGALRATHSSEGTQRRSTRASCGEPAGPHRLGHRQVGVGQVDVLAHDRDRHGPGRGSGRGAGGSSHSSQSTSRNGSPSRRTA